MAIMARTGSSSAHVGWFGGDSFGAGRRSPVTNCAVRGPAGSEAGAGSNGPWGVCGGVARCPGALDQARSGEGCLPDGHGRRALRARRGAAGWRPRLARRAGSTPFRRGCGTARPGGRRTGRPWRGGVLGDLREGLGGQLQVLVEVHESCHVMLLSLRRDDAVSSGPATRQGPGRRSARAGAAAAPKARGDHRGLAGQLCRVRPVTVRARRRRQTAAGRTRRPDIRRSPAP